MRSSSLALILLATACEPKNAELTAGDFTAFLATDSLTLFRESLKIDEFATAYAIDCRVFEGAENDDRLRLDNRLPVCPGDPGIVESEDAVFVNGAQVSPAVQGDWPLEHESWLDNGGFQVVSDSFDPWRGEAVITSEGDLQMGFHQRLPGGEDFRFMIAVDPNFNPRRCNQEGDDLNFEPIDGDWLENWSEGVDGTMFFLNGAEFHYAPEEVRQGEEDPIRYTAQPWFIPEEWRAGFAAGQFADDRLRVRSARYARPAAYIGVDNQGLLSSPAAPITRADLFYYGYDSVYGDGPEEFGEIVGAELAAARVDAETAVVDEIASEIMSEYRNMEVPSAEDVDGLPSIKPIVHNNDWREHDGNPAGYDGWVALNYSWIRFDSSSELVKGGAASGEFSILFDAEDNQSRVQVRGTFNIKKIKKDTWVTDFLPDTKFEENGNTVCGVPGTELQ